MCRFVLDVSANTHNNEWSYLKRMLDELKVIDTGRHEVIIKHQLFITAGKNIPLQKRIFMQAYYYAKKLGYKTTSSVFDWSSLNHLLIFDIPFVKIANNRNLDYLVGKVPREIPVHLSFSRDLNKSISSDVELLCCISKYPATAREYKETFLYPQLRCGISDHTINWDLYNEYKPLIYECHYKLEDSAGLDAGPFARTPKMLSEVL